MVIYGDLVAILNFCVDFLLLLGAGWLTGLTPSLLRCALASLIGAAYAFACLLPELGFLGGLPARCASLLGMAFVAYGRGSIKRALTFLLLSFALGGVATLLHEADFLAPIVGAAVLWGLCRVGLGGKVGTRRLVPMELEHEGRRVKLMALEDTGNSLQDALTGSAVIVVDGKTSEALTGLTCAALSDPCTTLTTCAVSRLRLIPYRTVGKPDGVLLAKKLPVKVGSRRQMRLVAFCPERLGEDFQALTGGNELG